MDIIKSVAWLYQKNNKVLCARTKGKDKFYIAGGKIDQSETPKEALIREIKEELNLELEPESIKHATTITAEAHGFELEKIVEMQCFYATYKEQVKISANAEIAELKWIGKNDNLEICAPACQIAIMFLFTEIG